MNSVDGNWAYKSVVSVVVICGDCARNRMTDCSSQKMIDFRK